MTRRTDGHSAKHRTSSRNQERVLNATVSHEGLTHAKLAAIQSGMTFRAFLDQLLLNAKPVPIKLDQPVGSERKRGDDGGGDAS